MTTLSRTFLFSAFVWTLSTLGAFAADAPPPPATLRVILLGTGSGPPIRLDRYQTTTLVEAGGERLLFDCGRGVTVRLTQMKIPVGSVSKVFLTHLHSDHIVDLPDLYLSGWILGRTDPFEVRGPAGTEKMMRYLQKAFDYDIHVRGDVDEKHPKDGTKVVAKDIAQGVVYEKGGVKVTAFLVDHGPVKPAYGYRVDYAGHSVVLSGDTNFSENLIKYAQNADVLIHEAINPDVRRSRRVGNESAEQVEAIIAHHTSAEQAGIVFARVKPRLAVFSHIANDDLITGARKHYAGSLESGEDLMTIEIGNEVAVKRFTR
jgi:ribonuclease Z